VSLSEGTMGGKRGKENARKWKILKQSIYYKYYITLIVSYWILGDHDDREWVSNIGGGG
jgi:hypothetical protein